MATDYQRRSRGNAQPRVPLQEVGLKALGPITRALAKAPPSKSAPVLQAVSSLLQHVAPLRLFDDFSPAHAPPEAPLRIAAAQLTADSTRSGGSYAVANAFASTSADASEDESISQWCSKARPSNSKSVVTVAFTRPEQLTGVFLALPRDAKVRSELVGLEALHAPSSGAETAADIAAYVTKPGVRWTALGVVNAEVLASGGRRLPLTAHNVVGLRLSFKGFAKTNTDKHHGLARAVVFAASDRIRPGVGGLALHTDAAAVLHTLGNWFRSVGLTPEAGAAAAVTSPSAAAGGEPNPEAQYAAIASLSGLSLATGSLASVLSLLEVLMAHDKPLPAPVAAGVRAFLRRVDEQYDAVGRLCDDSEGGEAVAADPDRTAEGELLWDRRLRGCGAASYDLCCGHIASLRAESHPRERRLYWAHLSCTPPHPAFTASSFPRPSPPPPRSQVGGQERLRDPERGRQASPLLLLPRVRRPQHRHQPRPHGVGDAHRGGLARRGVPVLRLLPQARDHLLLRDQRQQHVAVARLQRTAVSAAARSAALRCRCWKPLGATRAGWRRTHVARRLWD